MVKIYADVLIVTSIFEMEEESALYHERLDSVLAVHGVDRRKFESSLDYYRKDPHRWKDLIERVVKVLEDRRDQVRNPSDMRSSS